ncbi:glycosyltransferase [Halobacteriovorax sp. HLS]|uniref:glycosyltransferase n=1 Tax=Halobacteriovorax sp. HLS TaxID=2234000 RepID=UPI0013E3CBD9|nr:glycosyltransferase [Halobacteriovorax sp. HLS]
MSPNREFLLLTSQRNYSWFSMTEIIPGIKQLWQKYCDENSIQLNIINVDETDIKELAGAAFKAERIIISCFNLKISWAFKTIREKLHIDAPISFYVHGMATICLWPLAKWGWDKTLNGRDSFIVSCLKDKLLLERKIPNIKVDIIPFISNASIKKDSKVQGDHLSLYYAGRISQQKNLHTLLLALSVFKKSNTNFSLNIFGEEDSLGSPNMNMVSIEYKKFLESLICRLDLDNEVKFNGFVERDEISGLLPNGKKIFISPSLHSDENFGMAVLHALNANHTAVLSDWGGYSDFKLSYNKSVQLIEIDHASFGPTLNVNKIVVALEQASSLQTKGVDDLYSVSNLVKNISDHLQSHSEQRADFAFSCWLAKKRDHLNPAIDSSWIFENYSDSDYLEIASVYGSDKSSRFQDCDLSRAKIAPWVDIQKDKIIVSDPHKGEIQFSMSTSHEISLGEFEVCENGLKFLLENNFIYYES